MLNLSKSTQMTKGMLDEKALKLDFRSPKCFHGGMHGMHGGSH